jgi:hypothetical protein
MTKTRIRAPEERARKEAVVRLLPLVFSSKRRGSKISNMTDAAVTSETRED